MAIDRIQSGVITGWVGVTCVVQKGCEDMSCRTKMGSAARVASEERIDENKGEGHIADPDTI